MKSSTTRQLTNAIASAKHDAPRNWIVRSSYTSATELVASEPMTYREAKVHARAVRESMGYAVVERLAKN
jgi:hypothetical protein